MSIVFLGCYGRNEECTQSVLQMYDDELQHLNFKEYLSLQHTLQEECMAVAVPNPPITIIHRSLKELPTAIGFDHVDKNQDGWVKKGQIISQFGKYRKSKIKLINEEFQKEVANLKSVLKHEIQKEKDKRDEKLNEITEKYEELKKNHTNMTKTQLASAISVRDSAIKKIKETCQLTVQEIQDVLGELKATKKKKLKELKDDFEILTKKYASEEHHEQIQQVKDRKRDIRREFRQQVGDLKKEFRQDKKDIRATKREQKKELRSEKRTTLKTLREAKDTKHDELKTTFKAQRKEMNQKHQAHMTLVKTEHKEKLKQLRQQHKDLKSFLKDHFQEFATAKKLSKTQLEQLLAIVPLKLDITKA